MGATTGSGTAYPSGTHEFEVLICTIVIPLKRAKRMKIPNG
jgi:hypothetical protein